MPRYPEPPYRLALHAPRNDLRVAEVSGELDYVAVPDLRGHLAQALADVRVLVVDLTAVTLLSAAAMKMLLELDTRARARGGGLRVVAATRATLRPLSLTGLTERLDVRDDVAAAVD